MEKNVIKSNLQEITSLEGIQKYVFGCKKNGTPRAFFDVWKECKGFKKKGKKKKKHKSSSESSYNIYLDTKGGKSKKKKKHKKHKKHWHV